MKQFRNILLLKLGLNDMGIYRGLMTTDNLTDLVAQFAYVTDCQKQNLRKELGRELRLWVTSTNHGNLNKKDILRQMNECIVEIRKKIIMGLRLHRTEPQILTHEMLGPVTCMFVKVLANFVEQVNDLTHSNSENH